MISKLENAIAQVGLRMRQLKAVQQEESRFTTMTDRDEMIITLLLNKGPLRVSEIAGFDSSASFSTISTNISKLWKGKLVTKCVCPENQRVTIVELTKKGKQAAQILQSQRHQRSMMLMQALKLTSDETELLTNILNRAIPFFEGKISLDSKFLNSTENVNLLNKDSLKHVIHQGSLSKK